MMRDWMVALWIACLGSAGWSQGSSGLAVSETKAERARIEGVRQQKTAELDAEESACLSRFAVTDCQNQVGVRRRQMLSELKRQETILNAAERQLRAVEQLQRGDAKAADNLQRQLEAQANIDKRALENREQTQSDKQRAHQLQAQPAKNQVPMVQSGSTLDAKTMETNREAYLEKQRSLEKRRQDRDRRLLDQGKDVRPLPLPP
jgi:hypothetical protein